MKNACSYIDYLFRRITFTETEKRKPTVRVRVSCRTLYQNGKIPRSGDKLEKQQES